MVAQAKSGGGRPPMYKTADGKRVPGVTTIISRFKPSDGLVHWAWQQGRDGLDYRQTRDDACSSGHAAHEMIEAHLLGRQPALADYDEPTLAAARTAFAAFEVWSRTVNLEIVATEIPLVSEAFRFGGTPDAVGWASGQLMLIDWKSSNRIYAEYLVQLAAYRQLWRECRGEDLAGAHLLRVGKEFGDWHHHAWGANVLDAAWDAFQLMRRLYDLDRPLKSAAGV